jgi:hypothetical protein
MPQINLEEKLKRATGVICKQGMIQFPVSDTAIAIVKAVVGDNEEELDLIVAHPVPRTQGCCSRGLL